MAVGGNSIYKTPWLLRLFKIARMLKMLKLLRVFKIQKFLLKVSHLNTLSFLIVWRAHSDRLHEPTQYILFPCIEDNLHLSLASLLLLASWDKLHGLKPCLLDQLWGLWRRWSCDVVCHLSLLGLYNYDNCRLWWYHSKDYWRTHVHYGCYDHSKWNVLIHSQLNR